MQDEPSTRVPRAHRRSRTTSSFDVYGTLIDWETGMLGTLQTLTSQLPDTHPYNTAPPTAALARLNELTMDLERTRPSTPYNEVLTSSLTRLAAELGLPLPDSVAEPFGNSPGTWNPFPDTLAGLRKLARHYKLIVLSNVDNANIRATTAKLAGDGDGDGGSGGGARFDAVYTAQDIGSYKPSRANFEYLFARARADLGIDRDRGELLHVARSLLADHLTAAELGLRSVWISRGGDKEGHYGVGGDYAKLKDRVAFEWRFDTIGDFADEVERQFAAKEKEKS